jgi:hypothetical protein
VPLHERGAATSPDRCAWCGEPAVVAFDVARRADGTTRLGACAAHETTVRSTAGARPAGRDVAASA